MSGRVGRDSNRFHMMDRLTRTILMADQTGHILVSLCFCVIILGLVCAGVGADRQVGVGAQ